MPPIAQTLSAADFEPYPVMAAGDWEQLDAWLRATHIQPIRANTFHCSADWRQTWRQLHDSYWYWVERGEGCWQIEDQAVQRFAAPGLLLIHRGQSHQVDSDGELEVITVHCLADVYGSIDLPGLLGLGGWYAGDDGTLGTCSRQAARDFTLQAPGWRQSLCHCIWQVLLQLIREHSSPLPPTLLERQQRLTELRPALDYIEAHLPEAWLSIGDLAAQLDVGETTLRQRFHQVLGQSPVAYLRQRRIDRACRLLVTTTRPVGELATVCGFADAPYFCRTFKRLTGQTPLSYRELARHV